MSNPSKARGTAWETLLVRWLRQRLGDTRIERRALHGAKDMGDIYGLHAHGTQGIVEAKDYKAWGTHDLDVWKAQTLDERGNADADWAILAPKRYGYGMGRLGSLPVYMTVGDMLTVSGHGTVAEALGECASGYWVSMDLEHVCRLIEGV